MHGLQITKDELTFQTPIFKDATIVSKETLARITSHKNNNPNVMFTLLTGSSTHAQINLPQEHFKDKTHTTPPDSFIAVKRTHKHPPAEKQIDSAKRRADDIITAMALSYISNARDIESFATSTQAASHPAIALVTHGILNATDNQLTTSTKPQTSPYKVKPITQTLDEIKDSYDNGTTITTQHGKNWTIDHNSHLIKTLLNPRKSNLEKSIHAASIHCMDTRNTSHQPTRLIGAITTLEMLVLTESSNFKTLTKRLKALLPIDLNNLSNTLKQRNMVMHQGKNTTTKTTIDSLIIATMAITACAGLAQNGIKSKEQLINYLDFITAYQNLSKNLTQKQKETFTEHFYISPEELISPEMLKLIKESTVQA